MALHAREACATAHEAGYLDLVEMAAEDLEGAERVRAVLTVARAGLAVGGRLMLLQQMPMDVPELAETRRRLVRGPFAQERSSVQGFLDLRLIGWGCLPRRACGLAVCSRRDEQREREGDGVCERLLALRGCRFVGRDLDVFQ